jgi:protein SCO1/2
MHSLSHAAGAARLRTVAAPVALGLAVALAGGVALGVLAHRPPAVTAATRTSPALRGQATWAAGTRPAPAIAGLQDQRGRHFSLASLRGRPVAITFWDSHCTQECPLAGHELATVERGVPRSQRPVLVVVSVNPKDTPASARAAIGHWGLRGLAPWHWLMGTHARLARAWRAYRIAVQPTPTDIVHTEALYLLDRRGAERSAYLYPYRDANVADDMRALAAGAIRG